VPRFKVPKPPKYSRGRITKGAMKCPTCRWRVPDNTWYCLSCGNLLRPVRKTADYDRLDLSKSERKRKHRKKKLNKRNMNK